MNFRHSVPALTLTLALASPLVLAQAHRGGGGGGSRGGHGSGSHAVPRRSGGGGGMHYGSRQGYAAPRGVAERRHPRAGTGHGYRYGSGYYPGHRHGHGYGYGYGRGYRYGRSYGYYRPYYGYAYPYYSSYPYYWPDVSLSFGWGYGFEPYDAGGYYGSAASGDDGGAPPPAREAQRSYESRSYDERSGRVRLEVRPEDTSVYVDDAFRGTAREARIMNLSPGRHQVELVRPGFATERREVTVQTGQSQDMFVELLRP